MKSEPQREHQWLQQLVGEWAYEHEAVMEPGKPPETFTGTESVRSLGGLWVLCEARGAMPGGGTAHSLMSLGYDPEKKQFMGTFIASMMHNLWLYEGSLDAERKVLTLNSEGPHMSEPGRVAKYRDVIELRSNDYRTMTSHMQGDDGKWFSFMTAHYRRQK